VSPEMSLKGQVVVCLANKKERVCEARFIIYTCFLIWKNIFKSLKNKKRQQKGNLKNIKNTNTYYLELTFIAYFLFGLKKFFPLFLC
jgi:hypothetical protein